MNQEEAQVFPLSPTHLVKAKARKKIYVHGIVTDSLSQGSGTFLSKGAMKPTIFLVVFP